MTKLQLPPAHMTKEIIHQMRGTIDGLLQGFVKVSINPPQGVEATVDLDGLAETVYSEIMAIYMQHTILLDTIQTALDKGETTFTISHSDWDNFHAKDKHDAALH